MMTLYERQQWLEARRKGVGASECAAVCGCSLFETALEVWARKSGQLVEKEASEPMKWGLRLEEAIAGAYEEETGVTLSLAPDIVQHRDFPFMLASVDRLSLNGSKKVVELKSVGTWSQKQWGEPGSDDVPKAYNLQVQQQMACTELDVADIAALFGGNEFGIYTVKRNDRLIKYLAEREAEFWDMVLSGRAPAPDWAHRTTLDTIKSMYPIVKGDEIEIDMDDLAQSRVADYDRLGKEIKEKSDERDRAKAELLYAMGEATIANLPDGSTLTRQQRHNKGYTVKAFDYIAFTHKKGN